MRKFRENGFIRKALIMYLFHMFFSTTCICMFRLASKIRIAKTQWSSFRQWCVPNSMFYVLKKQLVSTHDQHKTEGKATECSIKTLPNHWSKQRVQQFGTIKNFTVILTKEQEKHIIQAPTKKKISPMPLDLQEPLWNEEKRQRISKPAKQQVQNLKNPNNQTKFHAHFKHRWKNDANLSPTGHTKFQQTKNKTKGQIKDTW